MTVDQDKFEEINPEFYQQDEQTEPEAIDEQLDELSQQFVDKLVEKIMDFLKVLVGHDLHPYQKPLARRALLSQLLSMTEKKLLLLLHVSQESQRLLLTQ